VFEAIAADVRSSASELVRRAAGELAEAVDGIDASDPGAFWNRLVEIVTELVRAKRDMAPFINLGGAALTAAERGVLSGADPDALAAAVVSAVSEVWEFADADLEHLATEAEKTLPPCTKVATLSSSAAVEGALRRVASRDVSVIVAESRPGLEGLSLAGRLAEGGLSPTVVSDAALPGRIHGVDAVLLGADGVSEEAFVNKTGSYPAALAAREAGVPVYVLATTNKIIPSALGRQPTPDAPDGLVPDPPEGVRAENRLFESVPLSLVRAVITEDGPLEPAEMPDVLRSRPVSPALLEILFPKTPAE